MKTYQLDIRLNTGWIFSKQLFYMKQNIPFAKHRSIRCSHVRFYVFYTKLKLKMYQIWDGFYAVAKLNGGRRSSATLTGMKQRHGVKDTQR